MKKPVEVIGRAEKIDFPKLGFFDIPAKIDTGAKTSALWASQMEVDSEGRLSFYLFDKSSPYYQERPIIVRDYSETIVTSSMGMKERRFVVKQSIRLNNRRIRCSFTLADRSKQIYPVLIGRNVLRGKFIVDVKRGTPLVDDENAHEEAIEQAINGKGKPNENRYSV